MLYQSCCDGTDFTYRESGCVWSQDLQGLVQFCACKVLRGVKHL